MIQGPLEKCKQQRLLTLCTVFAIALVLLIPVGFSALAVASASAVDGYLKAYRPQVFVRADVAQTDVDALMAEVEGWPEVEAVSKLDPQANLDYLRQNLGDDVVNSLGVTRGMMPTGFEVQPVTPLLGHIEVVALVSGLQARQIVDAVHLPSAETQRAMNLASTLLALAFLSALLALLVSGLLMRFYLKALREAESEQDQILEMFGATKQQLGTPTLIRGAIVGFAAGFVTLVVAAVGLSSLHALADVYVGVKLDTMTVWLCMFATPLIGSFVGTLAALPLSRRNPLATRTKTFGLKPYFA